MLKKLTSVIVLLLLILVVWFSFYSAQPHDVVKNEVPPTQFSTQRAFQHVEAMAKKPHYVGSSGHSEVRNYIVNELQKMGLQVQTQEGYDLNKYGVLSRPQNILARIEGTGEGKALLLMSHYDSAAHSSFGASDDASGVATVLEGIRAFLAKNEAHKNDIIILISDAEELGLNGAQLFMKEHPWAKDIGLAINFEARGSGGNSFMLLETNGGNAALINNFIKAHPKYPVTNSLAYSIYKMLPNDTDLTVLREQGNINGYNFAFIDDHFDYHTANDVPANLDKESLAQQGSYLMPLLEHFKDKDLQQLNSDRDLIYFSLPFGTIISYPFSWIFPMLFIGFILFFVVLGYGFMAKKFTFSSVLKGAIPFFISLLGSALLVFIMWKFCLIIYPQYGEIEQGFPYNGYYYIGAAVFLTLSICFFIYSIFRKNEEEKASIFVFPLFFWLLISSFVAFYLKGASYFIIPGIFAVIQLFLMIRFKRPNLFLMLLFSIPSLLLILPFVTGFPVALGLKILFVAAILVTLLFCLLLPLFQYFSGKKTLAFLCFLAFNIFFIAAHFKSDFTSERPKPDSLVYLQNTGTNKAWWYSYDKVIDSWTQAYFGKQPKETTGKTEEFSSKYGSNFTWKAKAPIVDIEKPGVIFKKNGSWYSLKIAPNRPINRMDIYADENRNFEAFEVNGLKADSVQLGNSKFHIFKKRWDSRLLTYYASNVDTLRIKFKIEGKVPDFVLYESSNDLLNNKKLNVLPRNNKQIPRPFVLNDAVILKKTINFKDQ